MILSGAHHHTSVRSDDRLNNLAVSCDFVLVEQQLAAGSDGEMHQHWSVQRIRCVALVAH